MQFVIIFEIKMENYLILMADIINSRQSDQQILMDDFKNIVHQTNQRNKELLLSPLTITLGDEFQGIVITLSEAISIIIKIEELIIKSGKLFKLRYVIVEGVIDTPINRKIAYGMMGDGLTKARNYLQNLKKSDGRFFFQLKNQTKARGLNLLFIALQSIIDDWRPRKDYELVANFLKFENYNQVALKLEKEKSLIWKRKKTLKINQYKALKELAFYLGGDDNE